MMIISPMRSYDFISLASAFSSNTSSKAAFNFINAVIKFVMNAKKILYSKEAVQQLLANQIKYTHN